MINKTMFTNHGGGARRTPRHRAREFVLQGLYQWLLNKEDVTTISKNIRQAYNFDKADIEHFNLLLCGSIKDVERLRANLEPLIDRKISELSPVEQAVLLIGAFELQNCVKIPYRVVINEAVELTKSFGSIEGYKYVNGVLDKFAVKVRTPEIGSRKNP